MRWYELVGAIALAWFLVVLALTALVSLLVRSGTRRHLLPGRMARGELPAARRAASRGRPRLVMVSRGRDG